ALPATGGASPVITTSLPATNAINLGTNNLIRGLSVGNTTGAGISGTNFGALSVRDMTINGTGQALNLGTGMVDVAFTDLASTDSPATGVSLSGLSGIFTTGTTGIQNPTGAGIQLSGSDASFDFGVTTVNAAGGAGVNLSGNSGNIAFGQLDIAPDAGQGGLTASANTGTIATTGGTISTSGAEAVQITGPGPLSQTGLDITLDSVSVTGAGSGIVLANTSGITSDTAGGFTVQGSGTTAGSGGVLSNIANRGASFTNASRITLKNMSFTNAATVNGGTSGALGTCGSLVTGSNTACNAPVHMENVKGVTLDRLAINGSAQQGINGRNVTDFALSNSTVAGVGNETDEDGLHFFNLLGNSSITATTVSGSYSDNAKIRNSSGTLAQLTVTNSTFSGSTHGSGLAFSNNGTASSKVSVSGSTFSSNFSGGLPTVTADTSAFELNVTGSTFTNNNDAIQVAASQSANVKFNISNNVNISGNCGGAINIFQANTSTASSLLQGTISGNTITQACGPADSLTLNATGAGTAAVAVTNNIINYAGTQRALNIVSGVGNGSLAATVTGNTVNLTTADPLRAMQAQSGTLSTDTRKLCLTLSGNTVTRDGASAGAGAASVRVLQRINNVFQIQGLTPNPSTTTAQVSSYLNSQNTFNAAPVTVQGATSSFQVNYTAGNCATPVAKLDMPVDDGRGFLSRMLNLRPDFSQDTALSGHAIKRSAVRLSGNTAREPNRARSLDAKANESATTLSPRGVLPNITMSGGPVTVNVGTLPAGKSVKITFLVTINDPLPAGTSQVSNQGTISGDNFAAVLTDDPDAGGASDPTVTPLFIKNQSPTANAGADQTVECGGGRTSVTLDGTASADPDAGDTLTYSWAEGSTPLGTGATLSVGLGLGSHTITLMVTDSFSASAQDTVTINVLDTQAPTITVKGANPLLVECHTGFTDPGATASDGCAGSVAVTSSGTVDVNTPGTYTITYSATDGTHNATATRTVIVQDTEAPVITVNGASPMTVECHAGFSDPGATAADACAGTVAVTASGSVDADTPGTYTITYTAGDGTHTATATRTVNVLDTRAPSITLKGATPMTIECHTGFTDPGATASDSCAGDLTAAIVVTGSVNPNAVGAYTLTYTVSDGANSATATRTVNVLDTVAPSITLNGANPMTVECHTGFTDPGATASDDCAGGLPATASGNVDVNTPGSYTITYTASDGANTTTKTRIVNVVDTTPPAISCPANIVTAAAPGSCSAVVNFTVGASDSCSSAVSVVSNPPSGSAFPVGTTTVTSTATDASGNTSTCTFTVTVTNPSPVVTITGPASGTLYPVNTPVSFTGTFTDAGGGTHTADWMFDSLTQAGAVTEPSGSTPGTASATRSFTAPGVYFVKLTVTDSCGGTGTATQVGGLDAMVVIYDPNGGFVTGGGWINSPLGAYLANPALTGKANFGFVSKYQHGAAVPSGQTEFQFKAGSLNFSSTAYEWLVVAGARAQYKGTGKINGSGNYGFMLTAIDGDIGGGGGTDKFRIKIWDKNNGDAVVYDNQPGAGIDDNPTTQLGGGSIVIHP
ncbi:MAG TPA: immunoglobulin-like domain-containing protein, partial [Pyrinomonadaceae bacterium]